MNRIFKVVSRTFRLTCEDLFEILPTLILTDLQYTGSGLGSLVTIYFSLHVVNKRMTPETDALEAWILKKDFISF